jgi:hypothetical protein
MSTQNRSDDSWILLVAILVFGGIAFAVWQFSTLFGLDMSTGASVMFRLMLVAALAAGSWKFGDDVDLIRLGNVWPVLLGLVWVAWWPALDYWAAHAGYRLSLSDEDVTVWWNAWYTEFGVLVAIIGGGFLTKKLVSDY